MDDILYYVSYTVSTLFEFYIISKYMELFLGKGNVDKIKIIAVYSIRFIVCTLQYVWIPYEFLNTAVGVATLFLITMCYGKQLINKFIAALLTFMCMFASEAVVGIIVGISNINLTDNSHEGDAFVFISVQVIFWIICKIIGMFKNINDNIVMPKSFNVAIIGLSILIYSLEISIFMQDNVARRIKLLSVICMIFVLFLIVYLYDSISKNFIEEMQAGIIAREKNYYYKQAELLQQNSKELRDFRHDISNHLYVLEAMIGYENQDARMYIQNLTNKIEQTKAFSNTGNVALDSIVNYKLSDAAAQNIKVISSIVLPKNIKLKSDDMVTIIGNLLDNSIEALNCLEVNRYIDLIIKYKAGALFITVKNSYDGIIFRNEGEILTKKENKLFHGIGLKSVQATVDKYDGEMSIKYDDTQFIVKIMLYV